MAASYQPQAIEIICQTDEVRVAEITLDPGTFTPDHEHPDVEEICYCLAGEVTVESAAEPPSVLLPGQRRRFPARLIHRLGNRSPAPCRFLLIHGVGKFNFVVPGSPTDRKPRG